jgi:hypothetical protein
VRTIRLSTSQRIDDLDGALATISARRALGYSDFLLFPAKGDLRHGAETAAKLLPRLRRELA